MDFLYHEDACQTLLLVYYAGHGSQRTSRQDVQGLTLSGYARLRLQIVMWLTSRSKRKLSQDPHELDEIVWNRIEANLDCAKSDVLEIFDWSVEVLVSPFHVRSSDYLRK